MHDSLLTGIETAVAEAGVEAGVEVSGGDTTVLGLRDLVCEDGGADDVRWADAVVLGCPERFGAMAGLMKDFLERIYYEVLEETAGLPWALFVKAGNDGTGAVRSIERIVTGMRWKQVRPPVVAVGELTEAHTDAAWELGATVAAGMLAGLY